jgi:hypothetical protein
MTSRTEAGELLGAGIHALAQADAAQLERLAESARFVTEPVTVEERRVAQERLRALGYLIHLTQRNLRLLRSVSHYRMFRDHGRDVLSGYVAEEPSGARQGGYVSNVHAATGNEETG